MCGRYGLVKGTGEQGYGPLFSAEQVGDPFGILPRYNAAPMQMMPVFCIRENALRVELMRWWLVPHWSKDGKINASTFNARSETLSQSKLFAPYFRSSRCLVPADMFYEWQQGGTVKAGEKQPWCIRRRDSSTMMFAGLFSVWKKNEEEEFGSFTILTTSPNEVLEPIHKRMPVVLPPEHAEMWLDRSFKDTEALSKLLLPCPPRDLDAYKVSSLVNNARHDQPDCLSRIA
jgi:putative SOS response-associated peptidase YedK